MTDIKRVVELAIEAGAEPIDCGAFGGNIYTWDTNYGGTNKAWLQRFAEAIIAEEREASGWVSVDDRLPVCEFENTELGVMVSQTVNIYGVSVDDNHGEGFGELHSDGRWVCYGGEHDFMNVKEVTHWSPLRAAPKAEVSE